MGVNIGVQILFDFSFIYTLMRISDIFNIICCLKYKNYNIGFGIFFVNFKIFF